MRRRKPNCGNVEVEKRLDNGEVADVNAGFISVVVSIWLYPFVHERAAVKVCGGQGGKGGGEGGKGVVSETAGDWC
jgi:hypothetical protein